MDLPEKRTEIFERLPVKQAVAKQILPAIFSQMIALLYNLADTYFVGLLNAPVQTAAVTVTAPAFVMTTAIANLFGIGARKSDGGFLGKEVTGKGAGGIHRGLLVGAGSGDAVLGSVLPVGKTHSDPVRRESGRLSSRL